MPAMPVRCRFYSRQGYEAIWRGMKFSASLNYDLDKIRFRKLLPAAGWDRPRMTLVDTRTPDKKRLISVRPVIGK